MQRGSALVPLVASWTRRLQARFPRRPIKGLTRFAALIDRLFAPYEGVIELADGVRLAVDSRKPAERWLLFSGNYQPAITRALKQFTPAGGSCLDVGANLGFYTVELAHWVQTRGRVIAFEANPEMVDRVERNVALNSFAHVSVVSAAVHRYPGEIEFNVSASPGKSSTQPIEDPIDTLVVPSITIDGYLADHPIARLDVIKIDIEGSDCHALLGAAETLARFRPVIVFEFKATTPQAIAADAVGLLATLDYELWALSPTGRRRRFDVRVSRDTDVLCVPPSVARPSSLPSAGSPNDSLSGDPRAN
jgi:FkbM family methyltransferase